MPENKKTKKAHLRDSSINILDRRYFALDQKDFDRFLAALGKASADKDRLRRTLALTPPWKI